MVLNPFPHLLVKAEQLHLQQGLRLAVSKNVLLGWQNTECHKDVIESPLLEVLKNIPMSALTDLCLILP